MALTAQQIQQMAQGQGGGQALFDLVGSGGLKLEDVSGALGQDTVNAWLQKTGNTLPTPKPATTPLAGTTPTTTPTAPGTMPTPATVGSTAPPGQLGVGANFNPAVPGGTTQNTDYNRYPTPIPQSPNYEAAANQQGQANLDAAKSTVALNNPNQHTTYGSQTYTIGPDGRPVQKQELSGDLQQRLFDLNSILPNVTNNIKDNTGKSLSSYDFTKVDDPKEFKDWLHQIQTQASAGGMDSVANALRAREQPRFDRQRQKTEADLIARGFNPGTEAWNERMDDLNRQENDFSLGVTERAGQEQSRLYDLENRHRNQGLTEAQATFDAQMRKRQSEVGEAVTSRTLPIEEYGRLIQAMQPQLPNFQSYTGATVDAAPILNATAQKGIFDLGRYGTSIQGELGSRGMNLENSTWNNVLKTVDTVGNFFI